MIEVSHLTKKFGDLTVLDDVSLTIHEGERVAVIGGSGSGKSTLLRCLTCMEDPTSGSVYFEGEDLADWGVDINHARRKIGMVFQQFNLFNHKTVLQNITLAPVRLALSDLHAAKRKNLWRRLTNPLRKEKKPLLPTGRTKKEITAEAEATAFDLLRKIGLSGRSFVPMLIGFGCSVPAIMATRTLASQRDRRMTILLTPFMSCSAKLPIYATFTAAFFPDKVPLVLIALYAGGMIVGILYGLLLKNTLFRGNPVPFVMELPAYRMPGVKSVVLHMWEKAKDFLVKAFTIIFMASIIIWVLQSFDSRLMMVEDGSRSMLAAIGRFIAPIFKPLGFGEWIPATALLTGLSAKEAVVSTLAVLTNVSDVSLLPAVLTQVFTPLAAASFLTFTLLYMPCFAAVAAVKRELGGMKYAVAAMAAQCGVAWFVACLVYQIGRLFIGG